MGQLSRQLFVKWCAQSDRPNSFRPYSCVKSKATHFEGDFGSQIDCTGANVEHR